MAQISQVSDSLAARIRAGRANPLSPQPALLVGLVKDAYAHTGCYAVALPFSSTVIAADVTPFSGLPMGARPIGMYPPGTRVLVAHFPQLEYAMILGSAPKQIADRRVALADYIGRPRLGVGLMGDAMHFRPILGNRSPGDFSAGRPLDALPGDHGAINDLGVGYWVGRMMAGLRGSDTAKIEAYFGDDLLRVFGYNMEIFTAASEAYKTNDEGEYVEFEMLTPFAWEGIGTASGPGGASTISDTPAAVGNTTPSITPAEEDQQIVPRHVRLRGYLGDVEHEFVCAPPPDLDIETANASTRYTGLLEIVKSIDGAYAVRSAREILLEKSILIPVPKRLKTPEDPTGDNRDNYAAAGIFGETPTEKEPFVWGEESANIRSAQMLDYHAWFFNRYAPTGLNAHELDWFFPEEDGGPLGNGTLYSDGYNPGHQFLLDLPSNFADVVIDHREGHTQRYYRTRSAVHMHDDGSVTIEDGYGSQIAMKGGSLFLSCFNDVWLQPGRSMIAWAPFDAVIRAGNCADITASLGDVRLKAERNLHALSGNSGVGGLLLENRSAGPSTAEDYGANTGARVAGHGITVKSQDSPVHVIGNSVYVGRYKGAGVGSVVIDGADNGEVLMRGARVLRKATGLVSDLIVQPAGGPERQVFALNQSGAVLSSNFEVGGTLRLSPTQPGQLGNLVVGGLMVCHGQAVFGDNVASNGTFAQRTGGNFVGELQRDIDLGDDPEDTADQVNEQVDSVRESIDDSDEEAIDNENSSPGNERFQDSVGFSLRDTEKDLMLDDSFLIFESRWQQLARVGGQSGTWEEPVVQAPNNEQTRPHPGQEAWEDGDRFATVDPVNLDLEANEAVAREQMDAQGNAPQRLTLSDGYLINTQS